MIYTYLVNFTSSNVAPINNQGPISDRIDEDNDII
jgi:hypothetical protein